LTVSVSSSVGSIVFLSAGSVGTTNKAFAESIATGNPPRYSVKIQGTVADINSYFSGGGLTFSAPTAFAGQADISVHVTDNGHSGSNLGAAGAQADSALVTVYVTAVDAAPSVYAPAPLNMMK
jgi:hypothetical protein